MSASDFHPRVTVAAIAERNGRFLVVEEIASGRRVYNQPAGHLDPHESLLDAVVRETREETGHRFVPEALVGVHLWEHPRERLTFLRVCFAGRAEGLPSGALDPEIVAVHWLTRAELAAEPARLRSPLVLRCLDEYLAGARHSLSLLHWLPAPP